MYEGTASGCFKTAGSEIKQTESERILYSFDNKIDSLDRTASSIITKVTSLGGFELTKCKEEPATK